MMAKFYLDHIQNPLICFLFLITISTNWICFANGSLISPYVGFGYNPIVRLLYDNDPNPLISPFYGYGLTNALGFGFDYLTYYGKPWYGGYGIGYPFANGYGLGYGMGMGYGTGFPSMNLGLGHGGIGYGVGYGVGLGAQYAAGFGPGVGGYFGGYINKKEGYDFDPMDFLHNKRNSPPLPPPIPPLSHLNNMDMPEISHQAAASSPPFTTLFRNKPLQGPQSSSTMLSSSNKQISSSSPSSSTSLSSSTQYLNPLGH